MTATYHLQGQVDDYDVDGEGACLTNVLIAYAADCRKAAARYQEIAGSLLAEAARAEAAAAAAAETELSAAPKRSGSVWGYHYQERPEAWEGAYTSREEAIADGRIHYGANEPFFVVEGEWMDPTDFFAADDVVEQAQQMICDNGSENAEIDVSKPALAELDDLLDEWVEKHVELRAWTQIGNPERIEPEPQ